jgi:hypothetical protein
MKKLFVLIFVFVSAYCFAQKPTLVVPDGSNNGFKNIVTDKQGKYIYTAEMSRCIMWEVKTGRQLYSFDFGKSGDYVGMDISPDGSKIAIASDGFLFFYNTKTGKKLVAGEVPYGITDLKFSADGNYIYTIGSQGIGILDASTLTLIELIKEIDFTGFSARIWVLADSKVLVAGNISYGASFRIYNIKTKQKISSFDLPEKNNYGKLTYLYNQNLLAIYGYASGGLDFFDIYTGIKKGNVPCRLDNGTMLASINTNEILISGEPDVQGEAFSSSMNLFSTESFKKTNTFANTRNNFDGAYFNGLKKQAWLSVGGERVNYDFTSKKYTVSLKGIVAKFNGHFDQENYNNNNGYLHIITDEETFRTIDLKHMRTLLQKNLKVRPDNIAISFTGDTVAVFIDNVVTIKNIVTGTIIKTFANLGFSEGGSGHKNSFFFSRDNKYLFYPIEHQNRNELNDTYLIRMNVATGVKEKFISTKGNTDFTVNFDKAMVIGYSTGYQFDN